MKYIGLFKWYADDKGFGVISRLIPGQKKIDDVFFHISDNRDIVIKSSNVPVVFELGSRRDGFKAINSHSFQCTREEWKLLFDNKNINLRVAIESGYADVMVAAINQIKSKQNAENFTAEYNSWAEQQESLDDSYFIGASKNVIVPEFVEFIKGKLAKYSFEDKKRLFTEDKINISVFSDDECLELLEFINKKHYDSIRETRPELYLKIIESKIIDKFNDFSFEYNNEDSFYNRKKTEYEILSALYGDYCEIATEEQKFDLQEKIRHWLVGKEVQFSKRFDQILKENKSAHSFSREYRKLINFPQCISVSLQENLKKIASGNIKLYFNFKDVVSFMIEELIPVDYTYIYDRLDEVDEEIIKRCCSSEIFSPSTTSEMLFKYLSRTNDIETVTALYKKRTDIQNAEKTTLLKSFIDRNYTNGSSDFVANATDFVEILGKEYVYDITEKYLEKTHKSAAILSQIKKSDDLDSEYTEKIVSLLFNFHTTHPELIDANFVSPFCQTYNRVNHPLATEDYVVTILKLYCNNTKDYKQATKFATNYSKEVKKIIEEYLISILSPADYMQLWEEEVCDILPDGYLDSYFDDNEYKYNKADGWLKKGRIKEEGLHTILIKQLKDIQGIKFHRYFKTEFLIFNYLKHKNWGEDYRQTISAEHLTLFEWEGNPTYKPLGEICRVFALFPDTVQVKLLKFIFLCIERKELTINIEELRDLNYCDKEYTEYSDYDKPVVSLSVSVVIEALISYATQKTFITDKEFYTLVYRSLESGAKELTTIGDFFDKCTGKKYRLYPTPGSIVKFIYPINGRNGDKWYIITFPYEEDLVRQVKSIEGRRYHPTHRVWFAPEQSLDQIKNFASNNNFIILPKVVPNEQIGKTFEVMTSGYTKEEKQEILHDVSELKESSDKVYDIIWCEGRESQSKNQPDVWWCIGHYPCNDCAIRLHAQEDWEKYTLFDFCKILGYDLHETNKYGHFKAGKYALFVTSINRFNCLLERLHCKECGNIIYPIESNYSVVGATNFHCTNNLCGMYNQKIYLNHCYSKKCRGIVDSREEARCPNGLVICKNCGTCCSTEMFQYRLDKLIRTGASYIPREMQYRIDNNLGHANNNQFFCYKCGAEISGKNTKCANCGTVINYL